MFNVLFIEENLLIDWVVVLLLELDLLFDWYFDMKCICLMLIYSVLGLIDYF